MTFLYLVIHFKNLIQIFDNYTKIIMLETVATHCEYGSYAKLKRAPILLFVH